MNNINSIKENLNILDKKYTYNWKELYSQNYVRPESGQLEKTEFFLELDKPVTDLVFKLVTGAGDGYSDPYYSLAGVGDNQVAIATSANSTDYSYYNKNSWVNRFTGFFVLYGSSEKLTMQQVEEHDSGLDSPYELCTTAYSYKWIDWSKIWLFQANISLHDSWDSTTILTSTRPQENTGVVYGKVYCDGSNDSGDGTNLDRYAYSKRNRKPIKYLYGRFKLVDAESGIIYNNVQVKFRPNTFITIYGKEI